MDIWKGGNGCHYLAIMAHFMDEKNEIWNILLDFIRLTKKHTSKNISIEVTRVLAEYEINPIAYVADNAPYQVLTK